MNAAQKNGAALARAAASINSIEQTNLGLQEQVLDAENP